MMTETPGRISGNGRIGGTDLGKSAVRSAFRAPPRWPGATLALGAALPATLLLWTIVAGVAVVRYRLQPGATVRGWTSRGALGVRFARRISPWRADRPESLGDPQSSPIRPADRHHDPRRIHLAPGQQSRSSTIGSTGGPWGSVWRADQFNADWNQASRAAKLQADRLAYAEAWQTIRREPVTFAYSCLVRLGRLWSPLPHQVTADETPLRRLSRSCSGVVRVGVFAGGGWAVAV